MDAIAVMLQQVPPIDPNALPKAICPWRLLEQGRDLPSCAKGQKTKAVGFELEEDHLLFGEQAPNGCARSLGAGANQPPVNGLVNCSQG